MNINTNLKKHNTIKPNKLDKTMNTYMKNGLNDNINNKKDDNVTKNKSRIHLYKKPTIPVVKKEVKEKNINAQKIKAVDYPLSNVSNELYNSIEQGRHAINLKKINDTRIVNNEKKHDLKNKQKANKTVDYKLKEKTPIKKRTKENNNIIINNKKSRVNINKEKEKETKTINQVKVKKNNNNFKNNIKDEDYMIIKSILNRKNSINDISQRLFLKKTISSKNKIRKSVLYTPRNKFNKKDKKIILRSRTCPMNFKKKVKYLLTSQYSESRFYTKTISIDKNNKKKFSKRNSINNKINYAFENIKNYNGINLSTIKPEEENEDKENNNTINNIDKDIINRSKKLVYNKVNINYINSPTNETTKFRGGLISKLIKSNKTFSNNALIHDFLYHNINSLLSLEIIISESKGLIYTKCHIGHLKQYKFYDFYNKFRAIPELNVSLTCSICQKFSNLNNFFCGKCYNFLCYNCQAKHENDFGHQIISIQNINTYCSIHNKKFILFCYDCNKNCCELCHSIQTKNHNIKTYQNILNDFKKEEKSISYIRNEIHSQLKILDEFINRYIEDLNSIDNKELIEQYFEEYINYFKDLLKFKEKLISKYSYNPNNFYNIMNVLNLTLPVFYNYNTEHLFKLSQSNELYEKYIIVNKIISFINNNSIKIFEGHQNYLKLNANINKSKMYRTIKPTKVIDINYIDNKKINPNNSINNEKYPKQILDLKYKGYFLLLKDKSFDIYDMDLNLIKYFNLTKRMGDTYNEIIIGAEVLDNNNVCFYNYKKILIIQFSYDFLNYEVINEYNLKINTVGFYNGFNNFGFGDSCEEKNYNSFINKIIDINKNEILSFGIRFGEKYIASIWNKNKSYDKQYVEINSDIKFSIYPIYSVLKYNDTKFSILENNGNHYNVKIYEYKSIYKDNENSDKKELNSSDKKNRINEDIYSKEVKDEKGSNHKNNYQTIKNEESFNKTQEFHTNGNRYENDDNNISEDSEENIDKLLEEIKINAEKREEEYLQSLKEQNKIKINTNSNKKKKQIQKQKEDIIVIKEKQFKEVFNLKFIQFKTEDSTPEEILQQIVLIKINENLFGYLDKDYFVIIDFEKCEAIAKINYGFNKLIYIDKTPNNNLLFKENNTIISYHFKDNHLIRINLPVFEYNNKDEKNISSWFLISGSIEFINLAKIIDNKFMISLFELRMEKWNLNHNIK